MLVPIINAVSSATQFGDIIKPSLLSRLIFFANKLPAQRR
jgi:hypothetical protein